MYRIGGAGSGLSAIVPNIAQEKSGNAQKIAKNDKKLDRLHKKKRDDL